MGMSTVVYGIKPADEKYRKMKAVYDACREAGVTVPDDVWDFFGDDVPNGKGVVVELGKDCLTSFSHEGTYGYDVDITKLPKDVTIVRFKNSW